jgi:hypothetical protein
MPASDYSLIKEADRLETLVRDEADDLIVELEPILNEWATATNHALYSDFLSRKTAKADPRANGLAAAKHELIDGVKWGPAVPRELESVQVMAAIPPGRVEPPCLITTGHPLDGWVGACLDA